MVTGCKAGTFTPGSLVACGKTRLCLNNRQDNKHSEKILGIIRKMGGGVSANNLPAKDLMPAESLERTVNKKVCSARKCVQLESAKLVS